MKLTLYIAAYILVCGLLIALALLRLNAQYIGHWILQ